MLSHLAYARANGLLEAKASLPGLQGYESDDDDENETGKENEVSTVNLVQRTSKQAADAACKPPADITSSTRVESSRPATAELAVAEAMRRRQARNEGNAVETDLAAVTTSDGRRACEKVSARQKTRLAERELIAVIQRLTLKSRSDGCGRERELGSKTRVGTAGARSAPTMRESTLILDDLDTEKILRRQTNAQRKLSCQSIDEEITGIDTDARALTPLHAQAHQPAKPSGGLTLHWQAMSWQNSSRAWRR
jgi:hypothetical protein